MLLDRVISFEDVSDRIGHLGESPVVEVDTTKDGQLRDFMSVMHDIIQTTLQAANRIGILFRRFFQIFQPTSHILIDRTGCVILLLLQFGDSQFERFKFSRMFASLVSPWLTNDLLNPTVSTDESVSIGCWASAMVEMNASNRTDENRMDCCFRVFFMGRDRGGKHYCLDSLVKLIGFVA